MDNNNGTSIDEQYTNSIKLVLEHSSKEFWVHIVDINSQQMNACRTYLWISFTLLGLYSGTVFTDLSSMLWSECTFLLSLFAVILALAALAISLNTLSVRQGYLSPNESWQNEIEVAYSRLESGNKDLYAATALSIHESYHQGITDARRIHNRRGKRLVVVSWLLLSSFGLITLALATLAVSKF